MVSVQTGNLLLREFLKDPIWDLFLTYINNLFDGLKSNIELFADDTCLFPVVKKKEESASDLTNDLDAISKRAYNRKVPFNPDPKKPVQEVLFS